MSTAALTPYEALLEHAELELELAGRGEVDALVALDGRWDALVAQLPAAPPSGAGAVLECARLMHERTRIELIRLRDSLLAEFATTGTAKRAAGGYGGPAPAVSRVDHSA